MRLEDFVAEWTSKGQTDLASAKFLLAMHPVPLEVIAFHCQQAVEKHLKAYLVAKGIEPEKTHDLVELLRECAAHDPEFSILVASCAALNDYSVKTRYPTRIGLDLDMIKKAVSTAEMAVAFIKGRIGHTPS